MSLCLIAIFKNESHILEEWIKHYITQGVDKFFLIDNGSNDNYLQCLQKYIDNNIVELVIDDKKHCQIEHYNHYFLEKCKVYDWVIVCDLDEFIYARKGLKTIKDYVNRLGLIVSQVFIPWKIFGSNGFQDQPDSVVQSFTKRINYDKNDGFQGVIKEGNDKYSLAKCIVRTKYLNEFNIHSHNTLNNKYVTSNNKINTIHSNNSFCKIDEQILEESYLHLNHYALQSYNWFMKVKGTRGEVNAYHSESIRTENYFREFDEVSNDIDDIELKELSCVTK